MSGKLNAIEARILGSLVEKELTAPEYYPLTLNALTAACNQKSNRDPVMTLDDTAIRNAIDNLRDKNLVYLFYGSTSRTVKYKHMLSGVFDLRPPETAVITVLLLRGAQTLGEIRERTGRLYEFSSLGEVQQTLDGLMGRSEPLVTRLERAAGQKEARYVHLLSDKIDELPAITIGSAATAGADDRVGRLQSEVESLRLELNEFRAVFDEFRKQFD